MMQGEAVSSVRVLYNFDYTTKDGRLVSIRQAEKLHLLKRTNADWWQVRRDADAKPFYVPAVYVREVPPAFIPPPHEYTNVPTTAGCCQHQQERRQLNSVLRNELITGNYGLRDVSALDKAANRFADKKVLGEMTPGVRRNYSVIAPSGPKKPVPCPRSVHPLSKSLETLAEEIQFAPSTPLWRIEQTSDYHTPSPDYLDASVEDMFWRRNNSTRGDANSGVQRSSSFKFRNFKRHNAAADDSDSVASRSLESLVDSGAEACSSSSYEWDRTPDDTATESVPPRVTIPKAALAFKNQTYQSTDDEDSDSSHVCGRPRSSSDTGLSVDSRRETRLSRSESHKVYSHKEQLDKPLIALKRNQKLVGCRRRPAILCLPSKNSPLNDDDDADEAPRGRRRPPKCPPSPAPHEKPLRVLPGGWAEFYCSDAGGVGRIYYFHGITGQRSWKPPRVKKIGRDGGQSDKSDSELRSGRESSTAGRSSRSPSPRTSNFVLPPGWNEHYDDEEQQSFYVHKTTGAKAHKEHQHNVPGNVTDWLHTLRRNTDSSEADDELRNKVESAAAASGLTSSALGAAKNGATPRIKPEITAKKPVMNCSSNKESAQSSGGSAEWKANPLFRGIEPQQIRRSAEDQRRAPFLKLCNEARRASQELIETLAAAADDDDADEPAGASTAHQPTPATADLEQMTKNALALADQAIIECLVDKRLRVARMRTNSCGSDMSDEVFLSCNSEAGTIFDHEGAGSPKAPPRRKKRPPEPEANPEKVKEILKQIEDLTMKAQEDDAPREEPKCASAPPITNISAPCSVDKTKKVAENKENRNSNGIVPTPDKSLASTKELPKSKVNFKAKEIELPPKFDCESEIQRSRSLRMPDSVKKERSPVQKSNSLKSSEVARAVKPDLPPKLPAQPESAPTSLSRSNSYKRAQEFEAKIQQQSTYTKPPRVENVGGLHRSNSQKRIQEFEQKVQRCEKKPPLPPEPKCAPPAPVVTPPAPVTTPPAPVTDPPPVTKVCEPAFAQNFSVQLVERKTFYPEISRDSVVLLPLVSQEIKDLIADEAIACAAELESSLTDSLLDGTSLDTSVSDEQASLEESFRSRKGSNGSDIVAWKQDLKQIWNSDEDEEPFHTARQYFSSSDNEGRLYFFAENSTESTWSLPKSPPAPKAAPPPPESAPPPKTSPLARGHANTPLGVVPVLRRFEQQEESPTEETDGSSQGSLNHQAKPRKTMGPFVLPPLPNARASKSQSMLVPDIKTPPVECIGMDTQTKAPWSLITDSGQCLIKEGPLLRAKIMEGGKKVKKNWSQAYVLLTDMRMLFFKDTKTYNAMRDNCANVQVEMSLDLQNADIQKADKDSSSRKNAFLISNHVLQVLCQQDENIEAADGWFYTTSLTIRNLSQHLGTMTRISKSRENSPHRGSVSPEAPRTGSMQRAKSVKVKKDSESVEDLSGESHTKIKAGLKKFFKRRPTMESLVKKGIWKDEPAFGSSLAKLCADCSPGPIPQIPRFVKACIEAIERNPEHMKTDGIYRASGNLSQVQRIRLHVDQNKLEVLDQEEEVHVLTGALKLFFRELKEPLIPFDAFQKAMDINNLKDKREKLRLFRDLVQNLPRPNHDTLKYLLEHLLRVTANQSFNRMHIPNLAIVFGPTLMWPEQESMEMALTLMQQNVVIECLLQEFDSIFK